MSKSETEIPIQLKTAQQALDDAKKKGVEAKLLVYALKAIKENPAVGIQKAIINGYKECIQ